MEKFHYFLMVSHLLWKLIRNLGFNLQDAHDCHFTKDPKTQIISISAFVVIWISQWQMLCQVSPMENEKDGINLPIIAACKYYYCKFGKCFHHVRWLDDFTRKWEGKCWKPYMVDIKMCKSACCMTGNLCSGQAFSMMSISSWKAYNLPTL